MIKLNEHRTELSNLRTTIEALEELEMLIDLYAEDKPGPAYAAFDITGRIAGRSKINVQFDRKIMVTALSAQRQTLVNYLAKLGIQA